MLFPPELARDFTVLGLCGCLEIGMQFDIDFVNRVVVLE